MLDKRYQVFITTSGSEMQPERIILAQTLVGMGFFSWGLEQRTPLSTAFARRQIDDCDYVILLLGSKYGEQSVSGVGYMHLEYIYAVTKQKPIIVFMHDDPDARELCLHDDKAELREKFKEFRKLLQNEVDQVFTYRTMRDFAILYRVGYVRRTPKCCMTKLINSKPNWCNWKLKRVNVKSIHFCLYPKWLCMNFLHLIIGCMPIKMAILKS